MCNHRHQYTQTTPQVLALLTTQSRGSNYAPWKCCIFGFSIRIHNNTPRYTTSPVLRTGAITQAKHTQATSTDTSDLIMYKWLTHQGSSHKQRGQAHGKGVLKHWAVPTTRESHFPVSESTVTLVETPNKQNHQLRSQAVNQTSVARIPTDTKIYVDVGTCPVHHLCNTTLCA